MFVLRLLLIGMDNSVFHALPLKHGILSYQNANNVPSIKFMTQLHLFANLVQLIGHLFKTECVLHAQQVQFSMLLLMHVSRAVYQIKSLILKLKNVSAQLLSHISAEITASIVMEISITTVPLTIANIVLWVKHLVQA